MSKPTTAEKPEFSTLRGFLWPIHNYEMKKFFPLAMIMCCILFNYTVLRNTKDTLIISSAGASTITFLKLYFVTPAAILFFVLYAKISNIFDSEKIFYVLMVPFLLFMGAFAFILNPMLSSIHPSAEAIAQMKTAHPGLSGFINVYGNWLYSVFFIISELWGTVMLSLCFWQFANQITRMKEAKRFYGLFVVLSNVALIFCGIAVDFCSVGIKKYLPVDANYWQITISLLMTIAIVVGLICMAIYRWMHKAVLTDPVYYDGPKEKKEKKKKPTLMESFKLVFSSPELGLIVMLVIGYGVTINLVEVQWKNQVGLHFAGDKNAMNAFMGSYSMWTGIVTMVFALFIGSNIMRLFSWFFAAAFTPFVILIGGALFFVIILSRGSFDAIFHGFNITPTYAAVLIGALVVIMSKAVKYCLFDPTKEMAYIPLSDELRTKGKAAVDVAGGRIGKSGGAFTQSTLLMVMATSNVVDIAGISSAVFIVMSIVWIFSAKFLSERIKAKQSAKN